MSCLYKVCQNDDEDAQVAPAPTNDATTGVFVGAPAAVVAVQQQQQEQLQQQQPQPAVSTAALVGAPLQQPAAAVIAVPQKQMVSIAIPPGAVPGSLLQVQVNGQMRQVQIPAGMAPGQTFMIQA